MTTHFPLAAAAPVLPPGATADLTVDLGAVGENTRRFVGGTGAAVMAVVKADGFGAGAVEVARTALAHGATWLGTTSLEEALVLRRAGLSAPVLSWLNPVDLDVDAARAHDVDLAVPSLDHLHAVRRARGSRVHLHLDTGMARDGADPHTWSALCRAAALAERAAQIRVVGVMGHLACADEPDHPANLSGRRAFARGVAVARHWGLRPAHRHLAATAATLTDPRSHHTMVRIGAGLAGIDPSGTTLLRGALSLSAPVVGLRRVAAGTPVGYGHTWRASAGTTLALLPLGYADGLPRAASGQAEVLLGSRRHPVVGLISMDQVVVDVGDATVALGDRATVLGPGDHGEPTVQEWAGWSATLPHEIVTGLGSRPRFAVRTARTLRSAR